MLQDWSHKCTGYTFCNISLSASVSWLYSPDCNLTTKRFNCMYLWDTSTFHTWVINSLSYIIAHYIVLLSHASHCTEIKKAVKWHSVCLIIQLNLGSFTVLLQRVHCLKALVVRERADASNTVGYARMNVIDSRTSFVRASVHSSIQWNICIQG